jgi:hypothetical protein
MKATNSMTRSIADGAQVHGPEYDEALRLIKEDVRRFTDGKP